MSGDPPSEPPEDGEGEDREPEEGPDRPTDETADPDPNAEREESESISEEDPEREDTESADPTDESSADAESDGDEEATADVAEAEDESPVDEREYEYSPPEEESEADVEVADEGRDADEEPPEEGDGEGEESSEEERDGDTADGEEDDEDEGEGDEDVGEEGDDADDEVSDAEETLGEDEEEVETGPNTSVEMHDDTTPIERKTGPATDTEQPLADHIEEMIKRLAVVVIIAGAVSLLAFPFGEDFIIFLWYSVLPTDISQPHVYHPLELVMTQLKAASLLGLVLALPVFVYETYAFMRPGLYPHERRYYLAAVPTSLVLASVGLLFGYFLVLPAVMTYFLYYSRDVVDIAFALGQTFDLMLILLGYLAIVFQIPLFIMLAIMMGLTTRKWLENRRLIFWGAFLGISFLFSPDPTGMAPIIVAATMVGLFEGTLLLLRWTGR